MPGSGPDRLLHDEISVFTVQLCQFEYFTE